MRSLSVAVVVTVAAMFGSAGVAVAAPKDYCADLKGGNTGSTCEIQLSDPGYSVDISIPLDYPDQKSVADYISQTRDAFLNSAKSGAARTTPYVLSIKPEKYSSSVPPRGTQAVVFSVTQDVGSGPQRTYKAFNWDQSFRKAITYTAAPDDKQNTPLWRVDDPLKTVAPIVQSELQQQLAPPPAAPPTPATTTTAPTTTTTSTTTTPPPPPAPLPFSQAALYNPANYQNFAIVNDGVIFFFDQGVLLPASAGPLHVLVPRSQIDPMIA
ncbi:DUF3298 domain-containing protein [Mycolicibacterium cosmeticum]|uniref:Immunogenic protein MPT64 n=1 Tax=Mycolicibacterium cosmeticum TaxID=258533 RepID=W9BG43_MYCCO|nr:RsiV family protein [Mycolicibacterium cosmeticum]TLH72973.1 DUF3298 domain-containing protein [Mycolicibacterium cosmeticum]CDO05430.1 immunogenic protein MPT64 [Mycolicibacterium cosmeticum]